MGLVPQIPNFYASRKFKGRTGRHRQQYPVGLRHAQYGGEGNVQGSRNCSVGR